MTAPLRIATRGSKLALWQANHIADQLRPVARPRPVELVIVQTRGDLVQDVPLAAIGGEGVFTKEVQRAVISGEADLAVHSLKDLPTMPADGLTLGAVPPRAPSGDALISRRVARFDDLPHGARVATGSTRRRAQLLHRRPDLHLLEIRGNVDTRLRKLDENELDAIILAEAGLLRLGLEDRIAEVLSVEWMLPAVGQGALGLECREDDTVTLGLLEVLDDYPTRQATRAERAFLHALGGGCQLPIAAHTGYADGRLTLRGAVVSPDGSRRLVATGERSADHAAALGTELASELLALGARELLG